jgi:hypothetical protein
MENIIFWLLKIGGRMNRQRQRKFSRFATTPTTRHRRLDPPYKYLHTQHGKNHA